MQPKTKTGLRLLTVILVLFICSSCSPRPEKSNSPLLPAYDNASGAWGYIDVTGQWIIPPKFDDVPKSYQLTQWTETDMLPVCIDNKWGYIDCEGNWVIEPVYLAATFFESGYSRVSTSDGIIQIDKEGNQLFDGLSVITPFTEDKAIAGEEAVYGYIDRQGNWVIKPIYFHYTGIRPIEYCFSEDLALSYEDGLWGYLNPHGELQIARSFMYARPFSEGKGAVMDKGKWGYIDHNGEWIIEPQYDDALPFSEGMAAVKIGDEWGFINSEGCIILQPQFTCNHTEALIFKNGIAGDSYGCINQSGKIVVEPKYDEIKVIGSILAVSYTEHGIKRMGYINVDGSLILEWECT